MPYDEVKRRYQTSSKGRETSRVYHRRYYHTVLKFDPVDKAKRQTRNKKNHYRRNYRLTLEQVKEMKALGCGICGSHNMKMNIDHDHKTGRVRGVLCNPCNLMLGYLNRADMFACAIQRYLEGPNIAVA